MAIYHLNTQIIGRSENGKYPKPRNIVQCAAYRAAEKLRCPRTGEEFDYTRKSDVVFKEIMVPDHAPEWMKDRQTLWGKVELQENRKDSQLARELEVALPLELTPQENIALLRQYCRTNIVDKGMVADICIHDAPGNPHAHILISLREITPNGFGKKIRYGSSRKGFEEGIKAQLMEWRTVWADVTNLALAQKNLDVRVDHRSLAAQAIDREPGKHVGPHRAAMQVRGMPTDDPNPKPHPKEVAKILADPHIRADALQRMTYGHALFTAEQLERHYRRRFRKLSPDAIKDLVADTLTTKGVVPLKEVGGRLRYTTQSILDLEKNILARAEQIGSQYKYRVHDDLYNQVSTKYIFNSEQINALKEITQGKDIAVIDGLAGSGKTTLLHAAKTMYEHQGKNVVGLAFAGRAAENMKHGAGISQCQTLHSFLYQNGQFKLEANTVLIIDEAGMVGTRQLNQIIQYAHDNEAKVVLLGDRRQIQSIEAGGGFSLLADRLGHAHLQENVRQKEQWAQLAVKDLAYGRARQALDAYQQRGYINVSETREQAMTAIIDRWNTELEKNPAKNQIILAGTRTETSLLNQAAREKMLAANRLGETVRVKTANGTRLVGEGEKIQFLKNEYRHYDVRNGAYATVEKIIRTPQGLNLEVKHEDGRVLQIDPKKYDHFDYGYASTVHKAQGTTADKAYILLGRMHDRQLGYVSASRAREATYFEAVGQDNLDKMVGVLARQLHQSHEKSTATAAAQGISLDKALLAQMEARDSLAVTYQVDKDIALGKTPKM